MQYLCVWCVLKTRMLTLSRLCRHAKVIWVEEDLFIHHIHNYSEICALHLTHPRVHTHLKQWTANAAAPGEQLGVRCLALGSHLSRGIAGGENTCYSLPPLTIPAGAEIWTHNLGLHVRRSIIRPRLPRMNGIGQFPESKKSYRVFHLFPNSPALSGDPLKAVGLNISEIWNHSGPIEVKEACIAQKLLFHRCFCYAMFFLDISDVSPRMSFWRH